ncbi:hypothetical protein N866_07250 [Actinotalea ferrariae CF5-4]|uniref:Uncharacterized protein n=1 Tax=Actinotalea ferrariae CF5-4 TaxID=948458 RepID=A0A021VU53_9CELL|nr:hypothetical protein N866_07250 [Actinotalea ferrariae CF5-4]
MTASLVRTGKNFLPQSARGTSLTATFDAGAATAGNLLVAALAVDKSPGTTTPPAGWTVAADRPGASVSFYLVWKVAVGGETSVAFTWTTTQAAQLWFAEYTPPPGFAGTVLADAPAYSDANVSSFAVGPLGPVPSGLAIAFQTTDSRPLSTAVAEAPVGFEEAEILLQDANVATPPVTIAHILAIADDTSVSGTFTWPYSDQANGALIVFQGTATGGPPPPTNPVPTLATLISPLLGTNGDVNEGPPGTFDLLCTDSFSHYAQSTTTQDWTGKGALLYVVAHPTTTNTEVTLQARNPANPANEAALQIRNGAIRARQDNAQVAQATYTGAGGVWLWIDLDGSDVVFYYSLVLNPAAADWVELARTPATFLLTASHLRVFTYASGGGTQRAVVTSVNIPPGPPTADAGPDQVVDAGTLVQLAGSGTDTETSVVGYSWRVISGAVTLSSRAVQNPTFVAPPAFRDADTVVTLGLVVTDTDGIKSAEDTVTVTSRAGRPVANIRSGGQLAVGRSYTRAELGDPPPPPEPTLWEADLDKPLPSAFAFTQVDAKYTALGEVTVDSIGTEGASFRNVLPTTGAFHGYRGQTELTRRAPGFPRSSARLTYLMRFDAFGSMKAFDAKLGYGLAGAPAGAFMHQISYGGTKFDNSWSARLTAVPANYLSTINRVPPRWAMGAYLYAEQANGSPRSAWGGYGIRQMLRNGAAHFEPLLGVDYAVEIEVVINTPGVEDGRYRVRIDGVTWLDIPVMWNPAGHDIGIGYFITQTFPNGELTSPAEFLQGKPRIYAL